MPGIGHERDRARDDPKGRLKHNNEQIERNGNSKADPVTNRPVRVEMAMSGLAGAYVHGSMPLKMIHPVNLITPAEALCLRDGALILSWRMLKLRGT
jgi:hypothetical protein